MRKTLFVLLSILTVFSLLLTGCGGGATEEPTEAPTEEVTEAEPEETEEAEPEEPEEPEEAEETEEAEPEPTSEYNQAPMLDDMDLPPVDERLPEVPFVIDVVDSIGEYGGTWHDVTWWGDAGNIEMALYEPPVRWKPDYTGYEAGLLVDMPEWSNDGKTITFIFRKGLKWSDGEPFAVNKDLKFWWEDMALNEDYGSVNVPWWGFNEDGSPIDMEFLDEVTWVLHFDKPSYIMPYVLAQGFWEWHPMMKPAHFLKQYHPDYEGQAGDDGYVELDQMDRWFKTPGYPCLMPWCVEEYTAGESWLLARNPYYWKVDAEGNQLPYIDYIQVELVEDSEVRLLQVAQGRYDCVFRYNGSAMDIPFLLENAENNDFRLVPGWMNGAGGWPSIIVNQDYHTEMEYDPDAEDPKDVEIRELLRTPEFLQGVSHAINRDRAIDVVWDGIGEAKNFTISPQSPHFTSSEEGMAIYEEWANAYADYDPDKAMELFDSIGFVDQDGDGLRDLPESGESFTLILQVNDWGSEKVNVDFGPVFEVNMEEVGVDVLIDNAVGTADGGTNRDHGLFMMATAHASEMDLWTYPDWLFPVRGAGEGTRGFPMQGLYYSSGGERGWKPEEGSPAARLQEIYRQGLQEPDVQKRHELVWEAIDVYIEEGPFIIGVAGDQPEPVVCKNYFKNVPEYGVLGPWAPGSPGNVSPEQFWMDLD